MRRQPDQPLEPLQVGHALPDARNRIERLILFDVAMLHSRCTGRNDDGLHRYDAIAQFLEGVVRHTAKGRQRNAGLDVALIETDAIAFSRLTPPLALSAPPLLPSGSISPYMRRCLTVSMTRL
jgi:hypothetical protein